MTISLLQTATPSGSGSTATSITSSALPGNATIGSVLEMWVSYATGVTITSVIDSAGQTYTVACSQVDATDNTAIACYYFASNTSATALTVTTTFSATTAFRETTLREITGAINQAPIAANAPTRIVNPGTGVNAILAALSSGAVATGLISGFCGGVVGSSALVAGTGFAGTAGFPGSFANPSVFETKRFTAAGANNATFTDATNGAAATYLAAGVLWQELVAPPTSYTLPSDEYY